MKFFNVNNEWKNQAPTAYNLAFENDNWKDNLKYKKYIFMNKFIDTNSENFYKHLICDDLLKIVVFIELTQDNKEIQNIINSPNFKYNSDIQIKCPITNLSIKPNEDIFLLTILKNEGKDEEEFIYYFVGKNAYLDYVKLYYNKFNEVDIKQEQILGEVLLNKRWGNDILNKRNQRKNILKDFEDTRDILNEMINNFDLNLLKKYEEKEDEEEEKEIKEEFENKKVLCESL